jgi:tetratricopeptide (TPR) repeat protein
MAVFLLLCLLLAPVLLIARDAHMKAQRQETTARIVETALQEARSSLEQARAAPYEGLTKWNEAQAAARRAEGALEGGDPDDKSRQSVERFRADLDAVRKDLEMVKRLADIGLAMADVKEGSRDAAYAAAFQWYGLDVDALSPASAASAGNWVRERDIHIQGELVMALDAWAMARMELPKAQAKDWKSLLEVAGNADPNPWSNKLRVALADKKLNVLKELAAAPDLFSDAHHSPPSLALLGHALGWLGDPDTAVSVLRKGQQQYPGYFRINVYLAWYLVKVSPPAWDDQARFWTAALAIRPGDVGVLVPLGDALRNRGREGDLDEAITHYRKALELKPNYLPALNHLGIALRAKGDVEGAIAEYRAAIDCDPKYAKAHNNLGNALRDKQDLDGAIAAYRAAIALDPKDAAAHNNLGIALRAKGKEEGAIVLRAKGDVEETIAAFRMAIALDPKDAAAHNNLGNALWDRVGNALWDRNGKDDLDEAIKHYREALDLKPDYLPALYMLPAALRVRGGKGDADEAKALDLKRKEGKVTRAPPSTEQSTDDGSDTSAPASGSADPP